MRLKGIVCDVSFSVLTWIVKSVQKHYDVLTSRLDFAGKLSPTNKQKKKVYFKVGKLSKKLSKQTYRVNDVQRRRFQKLMTDDSHTSTCTDLPEVDNHITYTCEWEQFPRSFVWDPFTISHFGSCTIRKNKLQSLSLAFPDWNRKNFSGFSQRDAFHHASALDVITYHLCANTSPKLVLGYISQS